MRKLLLLTVVILMFSGCATSKLPPYAPQLYDYLTVVDEMADGNTSTRASLISKFDIISIMYWLDITLNSEPSSPSSFIAFSSKTPTVINSVAYVHDAANELLQTFATIAMDASHPALVDDLVQKPTDAEAFLICRIGVAAIRGLPDYQKFRLPPEPMCPVVIAEYRTDGGGSELGFLGYMGKRFYLTLLPESEPR